MKTRLVEFREIEVEGKHYTHDVVIDAGKVRKRKKGPSKQFREKFGHTPLSAGEEIPWGGKRLIVGTGAHGALPVMDEVLSIASLLLIVACSAIAQVPRPDHIVIVIEENHDGSQIIQSYINIVEQAPYIDSLAADIGPSGHTADFTRSFDTGHGYPSQPNYLQFYSGDNQGCIDDYFPIAGSPFITANLARELLNTGLTFVAYSENRLGQDYVARHDPSRNWEGNGQNQIPPSTHADFSAFPSNFSQLPAVSYVIPTVMHDMHSPPPPPQPDLRVPTGDQWLRDHMDAYVQWCKTHNSLFILTFDEGHSGDGPICTLIIGEKIHGGQYAEAAR